ncbi:hypothetical protein TRIP_D240002 [uncultured Paludibacter sp.]|uniref:Uncharacterized protein n=1 Tax=uncultured Paludibacter sp. TaxID=497635 RepID=A0A653A7Y3_9BACT|nr:hypothetical protein TRIP_D240002 [uncultured Paludibacter sp.]
MSCKKFGQSHPMLCNLGLAEDGILTFRSKDADKPAASGLQSIVAHMICWGGSEQFSFIVHMNLDKSKAFAISSSTPINYMRCYVPAIFSFRLIK